ncbi:MAG: hypothetical protein E6230_13495 [Paenibacillus dendritiformis]|uniref:hypothetical protein n=1 Tax=Paenibacillus dendritiformis TaxID=130049 RepID=UPI00143CC3F2|nr:hypothetical protein [Paenibacillus dendritiformis]MDU5143188.1 hypothetical protein [Paenibacillus dendritiformis]NKI20715.1 hypothetical protein [Paenibacillus dendritiformis]NRF96806.1 hypothetical protein [Paenibacillus dendritiformis]GIO72431.1 hypothetical protein J27TS7_19450 [Paenibacillus dendritiformis]
MNSIMVTIIVSVIFFILTIWLCLFVTKKAYSRRWEEETTFLDTDQAREEEQGGRAVAKP